MAKKKSFEKQVLSLSEDELKGVGGGAQIFFSRCAKCDSPAIRLVVTKDADGKNRGEFVCESCGHNGLKESNFVQKY
jgi:hypothetical protein